MGLIPMPFPFIHFTIEFNDIFHEDTPTVYTSDNLLMASMFLRVQFLPRLIAEIWCMHNSLAGRAAALKRMYGAGALLCSPCSCLNIGRVGARVPAGAPAQQAKTRCAGPAMLTLPLNTGTL